MTTTKSNGILKSAAAVRRMAEEVLEHIGESPRPRDMGMARLALRSPHMFLARPRWQEDLVRAAGYEV